jgi:hypothetical protein
MPVLCIVCFAPELTATSQLSQYGQQQLNSGMPTQ